MLFSCRYDKSTGKLHTIVRGMESIAVSKDKLPEKGAFGLIKKAPKELAKIGTLEALKRVRIKHANPDGTVEVELANKD